MRNASLALLAGIALLAGCSGPRSVQTAREQVDRFHKLYDSGNYDAIWQAASPEIQNTSPKEAFAGMLEGVHRFHGKVRETKQTGWHVKTDPSGSFSEVVMQTTFEQGGTSYEDFVFRNYGPEQKLAGYHIGKDPPSSSDDD